MPYTQGPLLHALGSASRTANAPLPLDKIRARRMQRRNVELEEFKADTGRINALSTRSASKKNQALNDAIEAELASFQKITADPNKDAELWANQRKIRYTQMINSPYMAIVEEGNRMFGQQGGKPSKREQQIADLHRLYPNKTEQEVVNIVDKNISVGSNPFGATLTNIAEGTETQARGAGQPGMPPQAASQPPMQPPQGQVPPQPSHQGQAPQEQPPQSMNVFEAAKEGTGQISAAQKGISNLLGVLVPGQMFADNTEARQALNLFNHNMKRAFVESNRFPQWEVETVMNLTPSPDTWLQDPDDAVANLRQLKKYLSIRVSENEKALQGGYITEVRRGELANQVESMNQVINMIGEETSVPQGVDPDYYNLTQKVIDGKASPEEMNAWRNMQNNGTIQR